eukprot:scaffold35617_cov183-Amphora_coffeaeformis.AAC.1
MPKKENNQKLWRRLSLSNRFKLWITLTLMMLGELWVLFLVVSPHGIGSTTTTTTTTTRQEEKKGMILRTQQQQRAQEMTVTQLMEQSNKSSYLSSQTTPKLSTTTITTTQTTKTIQGPTQQQPPPNQQSEWYVADTGITKNIGQHESCFVMANNRKAYLIGGRLRGPVCAYDPSNRVWDCSKNKDDLPYGKLHHMTCLAIGNDNDDDDDDDDDIYVVAAWTGEFPQEDLVPELLVYHTTTDTWSQKTGLPPHRQRSAAAAVYDPTTHSIYVSHGNNGGHFQYSNALTWLDRYDIKTDTWHALADGIIPRDHTGAALLDDGEWMCVAAGRNGRATADVILESECYHIPTDTWELRAPIPVGRGGSAYGTTCDGKFLVVAGGESGQAHAAHNQVSVFDGHRWQEYPKLNRGRHGTGLAVDCTRHEMYIAGGSPRPGGPRDNGGLQITEHLRMID